jgi:diguanylate cyclase (GGDEF)-like protein
VAWARSRGAARVAIAGLVLGVAALAVLALLSSFETGRVTNRIRLFNEDSNQWTQFLAHVSDEYEALSDYSRSESDVGRRPLVSAVGSAAPILSVLPARDDQARIQVALARQGYQTLTTTLHALIAAGDQYDTIRVGALADAATLNVSALRQQTTSWLTLIHEQQDDYLNGVQRQNHRLRLAEWLLLGVDGVLLGLCATLLLMHQRRIERQAELSTYQAMHDALTGIPNRALLQDRLQMALYDAERTEEHAALLLLDLDRFKEVNDTLGHHHGDLLLQEVAARLRSVLRDGDTVARLGGDEFAILLRRVHTPGDVLVVAERALEALRRPADLLGQNVVVGGSIGVALAPEHSQDSGELLRLADIAMYEAKRQHLGVAMYQPGGRDTGANSMVAASELAAAIQAGQMVVHYQPKLHIESGRIVGTEALVRWQHPERGLLGPGEIVPLAEQSDLIVALTDEVLQLALAEHRSWIERGWYLSVAVNVGVRSLLVHDLPARIATALETYGTDPSMLVLEITESAFIADLGRAIEVLRQLRDLGVRISIDDFGTGYSSMTYLQALPADELKIDRAFVGALKGERNEAIVRATLQLGHSLGLYVTAEGVEDEETLRFLGSIGCDVAQGYHVCRPLPPDALAEWLTGTIWEIGAGRPTDRPRRRQSGRAGI